MESKERERGLLAFREGRFADAATAYRRIAQASRERLREGLPPDADAKAEDAAKPGSRPSFSPPSSPSSPPSDETRVDLRQARREGEAATGALSYAFFQQDEETGIEMWELEGGRVAAEGAGDAAPSAHEQQLASMGSVLASGVGVGFTGFTQAKASEGEVTTLGERQRASHPNAWHPNTWHPSAWLPPTPPSPSPSPSPATGEDQTEAAQLHQWRTEAQPPSESFKW